ncbi:MAG: choice-of-anchor J domain-containing protein [Bacteroidia bacterium]
MTRIFSLTLFLWLTTFPGMSFLVAQTNSRSGFPADPESRSSLRRFPCGGTVILDQHFDSDTLPSGWATFDYDGLAPNNNILFLVPEKGWQPVLDFKDPDSLNWLLASPAWYEGSTAPSNDYLISPKVLVPENACLSWYAYSQDKFYPESYEVRVSTTTPDSAGFMANPAVFTVAAEGDEFTYRTISLDDYANQEVYIAFRHTSADKFILALDDIRLAQVSASDISMFYLDDIVAGPNDKVTLSGAVINRGLDSVSFDTVLFPMVIHYQIDTNAVKTDTIRRVFTLIPNDTIQFAHDSVWVPTEDKIYRLRIWVTGFGTDDNPANDSIGIWQGIGTKTAIDPERKKWQVNIFPNPTTDQVTIDVSGLPAGEELSLTVYDLSGKIVKPLTTLRGTSGAVHLEMTDLPAGIYFARFIDRAGNGFTGKLVKLQN